MASSKRSSKALKAIRMPLFMECSAILSSLPLYHGQTQRWVEDRFDTARVGYFWQITRIGNDEPIVVRLQLTDKDSPNNRLFSPKVFDWKIGFLGADDQPAFTRSFHKSGWAHWRLTQSDGFHLTRFVLLDPKVCKPCL